jgi:ferredoxin-NADP reductase
LRVRAKDVVADGVVSLALDHPDGVRLPDRTPGAHIAFVLPDGTTRQHSLCGDLWDPHGFRIAVLRESAGRGGSAYVHDRLMPGDRVSVGGVHNHFPLVPADRYLFISGGIGIAPLLPMIQQSELVSAEWELLYGGRSRASMVFRADLPHAYGERVYIRPPDKCGLLDLAAWLGEPLPGTKVYCCGPAPLPAAVQEARAHWPDHSLRTERFTATDRSEPARRVPFEVELRRTGRTVTVTPDVSRAARRAPSRCRGAVLLRAGHVRHLPRPGAGGHARPPGRGAGRPRTCGGRLHAALRVPLALRPSRPGPLTVR